MACVPEFARSSASVAKRVSKLIDHLRILSGITYGSFYTMKLTEERPCQDRSYEIATEPITAPCVSAPMRVYDAVTDSESGDHKRDCNDDDSKTLFCHPLPPLCHAGPMYPHRYFLDQAAGVQSDGNRTSPSEGCQTPYCTPAKVHEVDCQNPHRGPIPGGENINILLPGGKSARGLPETPQIESWVSGQGLSEGGGRIATDGYVYKYLGPAPTLSAVA